jgi:hypothetical protein
MLDDVDAVHAHTAHTPKQQNTYTYFLIVNSPSKGGSPANCHFDKTVQVTVGKRYLSRNQFEKVVHIEGQI